ncbi:hypothetical protein [Pengzhenrongella sp.]|jgi:N-acyl-L-homoserine lactone synthetase|uniref:hypothetical protein n=1 Tax=Pengzhenrongella sp. TaxID=2888820 RepID=UPI002F936A41
MPSELSMHFDVHGALLAGARDCEAEVFLKWFGNTREQLAEEYGAYEDSSMFLVLANQAGEVLGAARMLQPGGHAGLKMLVDVGREPWDVDGGRAAAAVGIDLGSTWEVATLGVRSGSTGGGTQLSLALYHGVVAVTRANRMSSFVAILDERVRRLLGSVGILTRPLPGTNTASYLGSAKSTPVYAHCAPMFERQRTQFPDAYRLVTLGIGLDGVAIPTLDAFRPRLRKPVLAAPAPAPAHLPGAVPLIMPARAAQL